MTSQPDMQGLDPKALEAMATAIAYELGHTFADLPEASREGDATKGDYLDAAKAALASLPQQTAEPVAWRCRWGKLGRDQPWHLSPTKPGPFREDGYEVEPLYIHPASPPVGGTVKALEWSNNGWTWDAKTPFGFYQIDGESASDSPRFRLEWQGLFVADSDDLEAMKAAAQADYETRILSALASSERSGREAVIEECARVAEGLVADLRKSSAWGDLHLGASMVVDAIRNLAGTNTK